MSELQLVVNGKERKGSGAAECGACTVLLAGSYIGVLEPQPVFFIESLCLSCKLLSLPVDVSGAWKPSSSV